MGGAGNENINKLFETLPEECMEEVVSRTSPVDACRLSVVSKSFRATAESDFVWGRFLPFDHQTLLDRADSFPNIKFASNKDLFLFHAANHTIMDGNTLCFWLHKRSAKKCFLIAASITGHVEEDFFTDEGWCRRINKSRFQDRVTQCNNVIWFEIHSMIRTSMLSPDTTYTLYLVFYSPTYIDLKFNEPVEVFIRIDGVESTKRVVYLNPHKMRSVAESDLQYPQYRKDKMFEVELGDYFNRGGDDKNLEITMMEVESGKRKTGPSIKGIEIRPKRI